MYFRRNSKMFCSISLTESITMWICIVMMLVSSLNENTLVSCSAVSMKRNIDTEKSACGPNPICDCHQTKKTFFLVDCSHRALSVIPSDIPPNTTEIDISGNTILTIPPNLLYSTVNLTYFISHQNFLQNISGQLFAMTPALTKIDFFQNRLTMIPEGLLSVAINLETLDFSTNKISVFPFSEFENKPYLREIRFSNNRILTLQATMFVSTPRLTLLDLSGNRISHIPSTMFSQTPNLERLFFQGNRLTEIPVDLFHNTPLLKHIIFNGNYLEELPSEIFASTALATTIDFGRNNLTKLSGTIFKSTRNVSKLLFAANKIRQLPDGIFRGLKDLQTIEMFINGLTNLQCDTFTGLNNIVNIDFSKNKIKQLCPTIFTDLRNAKEIRLADNELTSIAEDTFWTTQQLEGLSISRNDIQIIPDRLLAYLPNLQRVEMSYNGYRDIPVNTFKYTTKLISISMNGNKLHELPAKLFKTTTEVTYVLELLRNQLIELHEEIFFSLSKLKSIVLSYNLLQRLPEKIFSNNTEIDGIDVSYNQLKSLPAKLFVNNTKLTKLLFMDNLLTELPSGIFDSTPKLIYLALSNNRLHVVHRKYFHGLDLNYISISGNNISYLPVDLFSNVSVNYCIDLSNNSLSEIPFGVFNSGNKTHKASVLQLHRNNLTSVRNGSFDGLSKLGTIFLNNNEITELDNDSFAGIPIDNIYLFNNKLSSLTNTSFQRNGRTSYLHIYKNEIEYISKETLEQLPDNMNVLLSCDKLKELPWSNRTLRSKCVTSSYVPTLQFKKGKDIMYQVLRQQGFGCRLTSAKVVCRPCRPGTYGNQSGLCSPCPAGGFYQDDLGTTWCNRCYDGSFVKGGNGSSLLQCKVCPEGTNQSTFAGYRACPCKENYTRLHRFEKCSVCLDEGIDCSHDYKALLPGFYWNWTFPNASLKEYSDFVLNLRTESMYYDQSTVQYNKLIPRAFACSRPESCANNNSHEPDGIAGSCSLGYRGWLCSKCSDNFYSVLGFCLPCPGQSWVILEFLVVLCSFIAFILYFVIKNEREKRRSTNKDRTFADIVSSRVKILLGFYQVIGELLEAFHGVSWAGVLKYIGELISVLKFTILRLFIKPHCLHEKFSFDPKLQFQVCLIFPVVVIAIALLVHTISRIYLKYRKRYSATEVNRKLEKVKSTLSTYVLLLLFVTYPPTCEVIFSLYPASCDTFDLYKETTISINLLRADYDLVCKDLTYYQIAAFVATGLYVLSFPTSLLVILSIYNKTKNHRQENSVQQADALGDEDYVVNETTALLANNNTGNEENAIPIWLHFLCENFKPGFWFWEILELARKVAQTMMITLLGWDDPMTKLTSIGVAVLFLTLHVKFSPMKSPFEQRLQLFSLAVIFINVLVASVPMSNDYGNVISIVIITLDVAIMFIVSGEAILPLFRYIKGKCRRDPPRTFP